MKILLATGLFPPQIGGPATYAKLLHDELPKRGIEVEVVTFGDYLDKPKVIRHFLYFRELLRKSPEVDLIYALDPVSVGLPALFASQIRDKKFVLRIAGDYAWEQGSQRWNVTDTLDDFVKEHEKYSWQVRLLKKIQRYVAAAAHKIIIPSHYMDGIVKSWNISEEKLKVIYDAPEIINSKSLKETIKKKLNLSGKIILTLSKGSSLKELLEFIELMPKIIENESSARLVISSEPAYKSTLFSKIKELGLEHRIDIIGKIYGKDFTEYIRAADVFVTHASYGKLPTELYVTMNLGTPIITTDLGLDHEIMQPGKTHVYMDKSDKNMLVLAILELINERAISYMFAKAAKKSVSNHTHEHMLEKILQEFRSLSK